MKWLPLNLDNADDIQRQITEVGELYRVMYLQLKLDKQEQLHSLLKQQNTQATSTVHNPTYNSSTNLSGSILSESDLTQDTIIDTSKVELDNKEWVTKVNKEKVLRSLHQAIENRLYQLEQFFVGNIQGKWRGLDSVPLLTTGVDVRAKRFQDMRLQLRQILAEYPLKTIRKINELKEALFYMKNQYSPATETTKKSKLERSMDSTQSPQRMTHVDPRSLPQNKYSFESFNHFDDQIQTKQQQQQHTSHTDYIYSPKRVERVEHSERIERYERTEKRKLNNSLVRSKEAKKMSIKPIYRWETAAANASKPAKESFYDKRVETPTERPSSAQSLSSKPMFNQPFIPMNSRTVSPPRESEHSWAYPRSMDSGRPDSISSSLEFRMKLTPQEYQLLQEKKKMTKQSPAKEGDMSSPYSDYASKRAKRMFLTKGAGRLASSGNSSSRLYLSGNKKKEVSLHELAPAEAEGLFITSVGPYSEPKYDPKPVNKAKWVSRENFKTVGHTDFYKDKSLPEFINSGLVYESANADVVSSKLRTSLPEKFVSNLSFVTSVPTSGTSLLDKQYSLGTISPNRAYYHNV